MKKTIKPLLFITLAFWATLPLFSQNCPHLILTIKGKEVIRKNIGTIPMFDQVLGKTNAQVDAEIELVVQVSIPKEFNNAYKFIEREVTN